MAWRAFAAWLFALLLLLVALTSLALRLLLPQFPALTDAILEQVHKDAGFKITAEHMQVSWLGNTGVLEARGLTLQRDQLDVQVRSARLYLDLYRTLVQGAPRFEYIDLAGVQVRLPPSESDEAFNIQQVVQTLSAPLAMADDVRLRQVTVKGDVFSLEEFNGQLRQATQGPVLDFASQLRLAQAGMALRGQVKLNQQNIQGYIDYQAQGQWQEQSWDSQGELWLSHKTDKLRVDWRGAAHSLGDRAQAIAQAQQTEQGWRFEITRMDAQISGQQIRWDALRVDAADSVQAELNGAKIDGLPARLVEYLPKGVADTLTQITPSLSVSQLWYDDGLVYAQLGQGQSTAFRGIPGGAFNQAQLALRGTTGVVHVQDISSFWSAPASEQPLVFDRGQGWVAWQRSGEQRWSIAGQGLELHRGDLDTMGAFTLRLSPDVDQRRFSLLVRGDSRGQSAENLMPLHSVGEGLNDWWRQANPQAQLADGLFWWHNGAEDYRVLTLDAQAVSLTPGQGWPRAQADQGQLSWDGESFDIRADTGQMAGMSASDLHVFKRAGRDWQLRSRASLNADRYAESLAQLPLDLGDWPNSLELQGSLNGRVDLRLSQPVSGRVSISGKNLEARWEDLDLTAQALSGKVGYDMRDGFFESSFKGQFEGSPLSIDLADGKDFSLTATTTVDATQAAQRYWPVVADYVSGALPITARVDANWQISAQLSSDNTQLPVPLHQSGQLRIDGNDQRIQVQFDDQVDIRLAGNQVAGRIDAADLVGWAQVLSGSQGEGEASEVDLRIRDTRLDQVKLGAVQLKFANQTLSLDGNNVQAQVRLDDVIAVDIQRLKGTTPEVEAPQTPVYVSAPKNFAAINLNARDVAIDDQKIDQLQTRIRNSDTGIRFDPLTIELGGAQVQAEAFWSNESPQSSLTATVSFEDLGALLESQGLGRPLETKSGEIQADLRWAGYPWSPQFKNASGDLVIDTQAGRFLEGNNSTEALRLLGIFNLATVTRRLRLDFSDLIQPGLAFDTLTGSARIREGRLSMVEPLILDGPSAKMFLTGTSDLPSSALDHKLRVQVPLSAQLPAAALLAGFPALAAGVVLLFDQVAGDTLSRIGETNYTVTGSFDEPLIEPIKPQESP